MRWRRGSGGTAISCVVVEPGVRGIDRDFTTTTATGDYPGGRFVSRESNGEDDAKLPLEGMPKPPHSSGQSRRHASGTRQLTASGREPTSGPASSHPALTASRGSHRKPAASPFSTKPHAQGSAEPLARKTRPQRCTPRIAAPKGWPRRTATLAQEPYPSRSRIRRSKAIRRDCFF